MPRNVSTAALRAMYAQQSAEVFLALLDINVSPVIRVVNNTEEIVSGGNTYSAFPFDIPLPGDREGETPRFTLRIDNVDRSIVQAIRGITEGPAIDLKIVLASSPNIIEAGPFPLQLKNADWDKLVVEGELSYEDFDDEPYPGRSYVPALFPGLF